MLSDGSTSLEPHYQFQRDTPASQAMAGSDAEERTKSVPRFPSTLIGARSPAWLLQVVWANVNVPDFTSHIHSPS